MLSFKVPIQLLANKSLFNVISKVSRTSEKRRMLDIAAAREDFKDNLISDISIVRSSHIIADGLTKTMCQRSLHRVLEFGRLNVKPEQRII